MDTKWIQYKLELDSLDRYNEILTGQETFQYFVVQILLLIAHMVFDIRKQLNDTADAKYLR
jgi:hypothetical protein